jgi:hypothetical protein
MCYESITSAQFAMLQQRIQNFALVYNRCCSHSPLKIPARANATVAAAGDHQHCMQHSSSSFMGTACTKMTIISMSSNKAMASMLSAVFTLFDCIKECTPAYNLPACNHRCAANTPSCLHNRHGAADNCNSRQSMSTFQLEQLALHADAMSKI